MAHPSHELGRARAGVAAVAQIVKVQILEPGLSARLVPRRLKNVWTERTTLLTGEQQTVGRCSHVARQMILERGDEHVGNGDRAPTRCRLRISHEQLTRRQAHHRPPDSHRAVEKVDIAATQGQDLASAQ